MSSKLAIIPARGGSKRIPRKNIRQFNGKPIIAYSIEAALKTDLFDTVMVSTEDQEIKQVALDHGAEVPFLRSKKNADDHAGLEHLFEEVIQTYNSNGIQFDYACLILATAPFVRSEWIKQGWEKFSKNSKHALLTVSSFCYPVQRALKMPDGDLEMIWPEYYDSRSQDLERSFHDAGQFYWFRVSELDRIMKDIYTGAIGLEIPASQVQDIDTEEDWKLAEHKYQLLRERVK